jgi:hypothetical protein
MATPLWDDPSFVSELEKLDLRPVWHLRNDMHPTLEEWAKAEGLELPPPGLAQRALTPLTFVMLTLVGAGAAAVVFHDRVTRILSTL